MVETGSFDVLVSSASALLLIRVHLNERLDNLGRRLRAEIPQSLTLEKDKLREVSCDKFVSLRNPTSVIRLHDRSRLVSACIEALIIETLSSLTWVEQRLRYCS